MKTKSIKCGDRFSSATHFRYSAALFLRSFEKGHETGRKNINAGRLASTLRDGKKTTKRAQMISGFEILISPIYRSPFFRTPGEKQHGGNPDLPRSQ